MEIKELIQRLNAIESGTGELPLPDTMIDEIISILWRYEKIVNVIFEGNDNVL